MPAPDGSRPRACPACGGLLKPWRRVPASDPVLAGRCFDLWRCGVCGSAVTLQPAPEDLHESGDYGGGQPRLYRLVAPILARFDRRRLALIGRTVRPPAALLDVGAGRGRFVLSAADAGFAARGIEPSARGAAGAAALGAAVEQASLEDAPVPPHSVDAITLWHVLEHLEDPAGALSRLRDWLRPGGALLVGVPNLNSVQARIGGARWYHLDVPRHRVHFTVAGLHALLERTGYAVVHTEHLLAEHNPFGMWQALTSRVTRTPSYLYHLLKRNESLRSRDLLMTVLALPLIPLAAAAEALAALAGRGGTVAVLARTQPGGE